MTKQHYTHTKDCPDDKAAAKDRADHAAATLERELRLKAAARAQWMDDYHRVK